MKISELVEKYGPGVKLTRAQGEWGDELYWVPFYKCNATENWYGLDQDSYSRFYRDNVDCWQKWEPPAPAYYQWAVKYPYDTFPCIPNHLFSDEETLRREIRGPIEWVIRIDSSKVEIP